MIMNDTVMSNSWKITQNVIMNNVVKDKKGHYIVNDKQLCS